MFFGYLDDRLVKPSYLFATPAKVLLMMFVQYSRSATQGLIELAQLPVYMGTNTKTVALSETAYERLSAKKREGESFSDVVERLAGERSLLEIAGTGAADDEYEKAVTEAGASLTRSAEETHRELVDES